MRGKKKKQTTQQTNKNQNKTKQKTKQNKTLGQRWASLDDGRKNFIGQRPGSDISVRELLLPIDECGVYWLGKIPELHISFLFLWPAYEFSLLKSS